MMKKYLEDRGWYQVTFLDIGKSLKRGPFGGNLKKSFFVPHGYKVYEQQHAIQKNYTLGSYFIDEEKYQELKNFEVGPGDYIVSCSGTIGRLYRLPKEAPHGVINQALLKITLEDRLLNHSYFSYLFQSEYFQRNILSDTRGTGMQNLAGMKEIKSVPILIPPLPEQRKIIETLDELTTKLDNGIINLKIAKEKLEIYRQAVLKKAFEGELTKEWREKQVNLPSADELLDKIKQERLKYYDKQLLEWEKSVKDWEVTGKEGKKPAKPKKPKFTDEIKLEDAKVDIIPDKWTLTEIQNISDLVTDGTHHTPTYTSEGVKFISVKDIYDEKVHFDSCKYISEETHKELIKRCNPEFGDLLITKSGTIGRLAIVPREEFSLFVSVALVKLRSANIYLHPKWIYYSVKFHISNLNIEQDIKGGLLKNYHLEDLRIAKIIVAPVDEQKKVIEEIENRLSVCDNILVNINEGLEKAEALRQSLFKKAFEGRLLSKKEIEACRREPDWKPAEELLKRIKQERNEEV